jgi:hypothetical protein
MPFVRAGKPEVLWRQPEQLRHPGLAGDLPGAAVPFRVPRLAAGSQQTIEGRDAGEVRRPDPQRLRDGRDCVCQLRLNAQHGGNQATDRGATRDSDRQCEAKRLSLSCGETQRSENPAEGKGDC